MKKQIITLWMAVVMTVCLVMGCGNTESSTTETTDAETEENHAAAALEDGEYSAEFHTDSTMFHVNEALDGKGTLTVKDGQMVIHVSLISKKILHLYPGTAEDAQKDGAVWLEPTEDTVAYSDGMTEEVYGFDIPVPALDTEFDCALVGEKGTWYDHKVSVSNPVPATAEGVAVDTFNLKDGSYSVAVTLKGGSGKASVGSPCEIKIKDGSCVAVIEWSSSKYDYMIVDGEKYLPVNEDGNSVFEIPIDVFDAPVAVQADTTAMSKPYLIDYTLQFDSATISEK